MNRDKHIIVTSILCLLAFLFVGELKAQDNIRLGYCSDKTGGTLAAQTDQAAEMGAAILLPAQVLKKYAGNKINRIDFAIGKKVGSMMTVFVTKQLGGTPLSTKTFYEYQEGWNSITLNTPVSITGDADLYVGYIFYTDASTANAPVIMFDFNSGAVEGVNWYSYNNKWWDVDARSIDFNLCIRAYAAGGSLPVGDVGIRKLSISDIVTQNNPTSLTVQMCNYGTDTVRQAELQLMLNNQVFDTRTLSDIELPHNQEEKIELDNILMPKEGNNMLSISVTSVNGQSDSDMSDNSQEKNIYVIREGAQPVSHKILFEEFTSEVDATAPVADSLYSTCIGKRNDVIMIKHHTDGDKFTLPEEIPYSYFFEGGRVFHPALMVDRNIFSGMDERGPAYFVPYEISVDEMLRTSANIPCYIELTVSPQYSSLDRQAEIHVTGSSEVCEMPYQKELRLTVYAIEDSISTSTQQGVQQYIQNGVVRKIVSTSCWGDPIDISDYAFEKSYTFSLDPGWNEKHLRIVAFASNYDSTDAGLCQVYNTAEAALVSPETAVQTFEADSSEPRIWYAGNQLQVEQGFTLNAVYDMAGRKVSPSNLTEGIYVLRISDGRHSFCKKYMINK